MVTLLTQACMLTRTVKQLKPDFYSDDPSSNPAAVYNFDCKKFPSTTSKGSC